MGKRRKRSSVMSANGMLQVMRKRCDECLFSDAKIVSEERKADLLRTCERRDCHFTCHKATIAGVNIVCRGFFDERSSNLIRVMGRLNAIEFVDAPEEREQ